MAKKYIDANEFWNRLISVSENDWVGFDTIDEVLSGMPAEPRWIPCSERMPKEEGAYLVTEVSYWELYVSKGYYVQENGVHIWRNDTYEYDIIDPIAWMPLPEPYKGGEEE